MDGLQGLPTIPFDRIYLVSEVLTSVMIRAAANSGCSVRWRRVVGGNMGAPRRARHQEEATLFSICSSERPRVSGTMNATSAQPARQIKP